MFCNQCGAEMQPAYNVCPRCGKPATHILIARPSRLAYHLPTLSILWMIVGGLCLIPAVILLLLSRIVHIAVPLTETVARSLGPLILMILGGTIFLIGAGGLLIGWGLMRHEAWARIAAIVLGILALFHPPLLTLLGIYTLWVLLGGGSEAEYGRLASAS